MRILSVSLALAGLLCQGVWGAFDAPSQTAILASSLKSYYGIEGTLELTALNALKPLEKTPTSVELLEVPQNISSTMLIKARYLEGSEPVAEVSSAFKAQWRVNAFVPRRQLQRKAALSPSDFEVQAIDRLSLKQVPVDTSIALADYETTNPISAGAPLTWNNLKPLPLVRKGALVDVVAQEGNMRITTRAVATQDAGRNEQVVMRNPSSNRSFEAYVINENTVQIRF